MIENNHYYCYANFIQLFLHQLKIFIKMSIQKQIPISTNPDYIIVNPLVIHNQIELQ
jgi:hypothetical protein